MKALYSEFKRNVLNPWYYMTMLMLPFLYVALAINHAAAFLSAGLERLSGYMGKRIK